MSKYLLWKIDLKEYCKFLLIIVITILTIYIINCLSKIKEGMNTNNDDFVSYKISNGREVSKSDFKTGKWPWNNGNENINVDFESEITEVTNIWIDLVTNDNSIGSSNNNDNRISLIGDLFCLTTPDGEECKSDEDYCASLFGLSNKLIMGKSNIENYFIYFVNLPGLSARSINEPIFTIQKISNDIYLNSVLITWTWEDGPGSEDIEPLESRITFIYKYDENRGNKNKIDNYCIIQFHSSQMPDIVDSIPDYITD